MADEIGNLIEGKKEKAKKESKADKPLPGQAEQPAKQPELTPEQLEQQKRLKAEMQIRAEASRYPIVHIFDFSLLPTEDGILTVPFDMNYKSLGSFLLGTHAEKKLYEFLAKREEERKKQ